jgi:hypothetical protein
MNFATVHGVSQARNKLVAVGDFPLRMRFSMVAGTNGETAMGMS